MCYPLPGPRCHKHASENLSKAVSRLESAFVAEKTQTSRLNKKSLIKALENFRVRQSDYDTTSTGLVALAQEYENNKGTVDQDAYSRRLYYAKLKHKQQAEWLREFNRLKKTKAETSPTLISLEASIKTTTFKIVEEGRMFDPALRRTENNAQIKTQHQDRTTSKVKVQPQPQPTPIVEEQLNHTPVVPTRVQETNEENHRLKPEYVSTNKTTVEDELPVNKLNKIKVKSFDELEANKPLRKKTVRPMYFAPVKAKSTVGKVKSGFEKENFIDIVRSSKKNFAHQSLTDNVGNVVADSVIITPHGAMWELNKNGYKARIPAVSNKSYYHQFGLLQNAA